MNRKSFWMVLMACCLLALLSFCRGDASSTEGNGSQEAAILTKARAPLPAPFVSDEPLGFAALFDTLTTHYFVQLNSFWGQEFNSFCAAYGLDNQDTLNAVTWFRIRFLHALMTGRGAEDCATGGIFKIPYFWHWVDPNPRHQIRLLPEGKLLKDVRPLPRFSRYASMADVDRTPSLYLQDMVTEEPKYTHPDCGSFHTFGWCSEREMAFIQFAALYGYRGKVVAEGIHSWSCLWVTFTDSSGTGVPVECQIDNTFDHFNDRSIPEGTAYDDWAADTGQNAGWYNRMARSPAEARMIGQIMVSPGAVRRIDGSVREFFR